MKTPGMRRHPTMEEWAEDMAHEENFVGWTEGDFRRSVWNRWGVGTHSEAADEMWLVFDATRRRQDAAHGPEEGK